MEELNLSDEINNGIIQIKNLKNEGNSVFKTGQYESAIDFYTKALDLVLNCNEKLKNVPKLENDLQSLKDRIKSENISIHSNLALCNFKLNKFKESSEYDLKIITSLDSFFDKSYARLVQTYSKLGSLDNAVYYYLILKRNFNQETFNKYTETFKTIESENTEFSIKLKAAEKPITKASAASKYFSNRFIYIGVIILLGVIWYFYKSQTKIEEPEF